ncbi:cytokine receptor-like isoform X2 [Cloeon dipterum]
MACSETVCLVLLAVLLLPCVSSGCMFGIPTLGATYPAGDIFLEKGQSLKITCKLDEVDNVTNANKIFFTDGNERVPKRFVNVIDTSTAKLSIPNMTLTNHSVYYCRLQTMDKVVCLNQVVVGLKPQEPQNVTCISKNWETFTCKWDKVDHYTPTTYTILYTLAGRGSRSQLLRCPTDSDKRNNTCTWDFSTSPIYRTAHEFYTITLAGYNALGNVTFPPIRYHHYAHVIPRPPENLRAQNVTSHSVTLKWAVAYPMQIFPPGLITRVEFRHKWIPEGQWITVNTTNLPYNPVNMTLHITNLPYAHTNYTIRVQHKSQKAQDKGYSEPATVNITTKSEKPTASPKVDMGGFENEKPNDASLRNIYLYWERIPECLYNSDDFEYQIEIEEESGALLDIVKADKTSSYIKIKGLLHDAYTFKIYARNNLGVADAPSVIKVPHYKSCKPFCIKGPLAFTKIEYDDGVTELSWNEPDTPGLGELSGLLPIVDYTIFWCENSKDKAFQCTGSMNWIRVPANANWHNVTIPDKNRTYQFAISANSKNQSSGLSWTVCTVAHDKVIEGLTQVGLSKVGSTFLEISWNLQCSHRIGQVLGYNFRYCPIIPAQLRNCKEPSKVQFVPGDANTELGNITGLMPYTAYMYNLTVLSMGGEGVGETEFATTLEAAPEPPRDLKATYVTNSTIHISWFPPARSNGNIKYYEVNYTLGTTKIDGIFTSTGLYDLPSFTNMSIYVRACTIACSNKSNVIMTRTLIGTPSKIDMVHLRRQLNESNVKVSWNEPVNRAGYIDFYQLWVEEHGKNVSDTPYTVSNQTNQLVSIPDCSGDKPLVYTFRVRAVNKDEYNQSQYGPWSDPREENCYSSGFPSTEVITVFTIFAAVILISVVWCYGKRFWICLEKMRNVPVELPPGLDPSSQTFAPTQKSPLDSSKPTPEDIDDSEMLLTKSERHGRNPSGDSSGCSSAGNNDSISLTSNRQISTDSGTEADQLTEGDSTQVQVHVEMDPVDAVRNWQVMPDKFTPDQSNQQIEMLSCMQTYCKIGEANTGDMATTGPYIMLGEQQQPPQENNKGSNGYVTVEQVDLMLSRQDSNGYSAAPPNGFMLRKGSTSTADETPSSCSSSTSSAPASPTMPQAALNGYAKVGDPGPPAPPKSANSSGYVALGDVNLSFKPPQHEDETPKIKQC